MTVSLGARRRAQQDGDGPASFRVAGWLVEESEAT